jgi:hypothetical protein
MGAPGRVLLAIALVVVVSVARPEAGRAFSVLAHQAVVDRSWDAAIVPALQRRFPLGDPTRARAFAYGGSHVADLGYFPLGSELFTELLHYVRTGDFIGNLLASARDANEYAFALGALAHWISDTTGHPEATNRVVPEIYPELREKFGDEVTYAEDQSSHLQTEFRFDVFQLSRVKGGRDLFHHSLQFEVATRALDEAMQRTYGLALADLFTSTDAAILTYRYAFRGLIHEATGIAWQLYEADIKTLDPEMTPAGFVYDLSREDFETEFGKVYAEPGYFAKFFAFLVKLVPDVGPFRRSVLKPLPPEARERYVAALDHAVARYRSLVASVGRRKGLDLPSQNLDTAAPTRFGEYPPADEAYAALVEKLAADPAKAPPPALRADIRRFYADRPLGVARDDDGRELDEALTRLAIAGPSGSGSQRNNSK